VQVLCNTSKVGDAIENVTVKKNISLLTMRQSPHLICNQNYCEQKAHENNDVLVWKGLVQRRTLALTNSEWQQKHTYRLKPVF
jgi:hypothetical protein